jgi:trehalose 6-phosphate synthase
VLSRFAGAAKELNCALLVNPYDSEGVAIAIDRALAMPLAERKERHDTNYKALLQHDLSQWAETFLDTLEGPRPYVAEAPSRPLRAAG